MLNQHAAQISQQQQQLRTGLAVTLRLLAVQDVDALTDFYESIPPEDYRFYLARQITRLDAEKKCASADQDGQICLIAERDEQIVGYAWCEWETGADLSTFGICIRRGFQGGGMGRLLMSELLTIAKRFAPPRMCLTVQKANPRAVDLYQTLGFHLIREQLREGDQEPEYYMEMDVQSVG